MARSRHLEAFIGQGSSVEGLLIGWLHFQCCITVLLGLSKPFQLQVAQGSANTHIHTHVTCDLYFCHQQLIVFDAWLKGIMSLWLIDCESDLMIKAEGMKKIIFIWNRWGMRFDICSDSFVCCMAVAGVCLLWLYTQALFRSRGHTHANMKDIFHVSVTASSATWPQQFT